MGRSDSSLLPIAQRCIVLALLAATIAPANLAAQQSKRTTDLKGRVANPAGQRVRLTLWHDNMHAERMEMLGECFADEGGAFELPGVRWFQRQEWGSHQLLLFAQTKDRVAVRQLRGDKQDPTRVGITLRKKVDVRGRFVDATSGRPIENAWVWPSIIGGTDNVWVTQPLLPWHATTDANGDFVLRGLPEGLSIKALAGGRDHARTWVTLPEPNARPTDIELQAGCTVSGLVRMPDGKPAARVLVVATGFAEYGQGKSQTWTDDEGRFELRSLGPGKWKVWANAKDLTVIAATDLRVRPDKPLTDLDVQLVHGGFIVGKLIDQATGQPIVPNAGTDIAMYGPARGDGGSCQAFAVQKDGTFRIRAPAGKNRIYLRAAPKGYNEPTRIVDVVEGKETEVVFRLVKRAPGKKRNQINVSNVEFER